MELCQISSFYRIINIFKIRRHDVMQGFAEVCFKLFAGIAMLTFVGKYILHCGVGDL